MTAPDTEAPSLSLQDIRDKHVCAIRSAIEYIATLEAEVALLKSANADLTGEEWTDVRQIEAEAEIASLRAEIARKDGALRPFSAAARAIGTERGPFRFETGTGYRTITREDLLAAYSALTKAQPMPNEIDTGALAAATQAVMAQMRVQMGHSCPDPVTAEIYAREFARAALRAASGAEAIPLPAPPKEPGR